MTFAQFRCYHNSTQQRKASIANRKDSMNLVFVNQNEEDTIHPLTTREIEEAQQQDSNLKTQAEKEGYSTQLVENTKVLQNGHTKMPSTPCSSLVSPLLTTSRDQAS